MAITPQEIADDVAAAFSILQKIDGFVTAAKSAPPAPIQAPAPPLEPLAVNVKNFLSFLHAIAAKIEGPSPNPPSASPPA